MIYRTNIKPFEELWIECDTNLALSILASNSSDGKIHAYNNVYSYGARTYKTICGGDVWHLLVNYNYFGLNNIIKHEKSIVINNDKSFVSKIKRNLRHKKNVIVDIDMFYWMPASGCWNRHHWYHFSLVTGYDSKKKFFYALDANAKGYKEFEIPQDRFIKAIKSCEHEKTAYSFEYNKKSSLPRITTRTLSENAVNIIHSIEDLTKETFWILSDKGYRASEYLELITMRLRQIADRQIANNRLVQEMRVRNIFPKEKADKLCLICDNLYSDWNDQRQAVMYAYKFRDTRNKIEKININIRLLLKEEENFWKLFCEYMPEQEIEII